MNLEFRGGGGDAGEGVATRRPQCPAHRYHLLREAGVRSTVEREREEELLQLFQGWGLRCGSEEGSYLKLVDFGITPL